MSALRRWLFARRARAHRRWLKRNKVLIAAHHSVRRNQTEAVP